MTLNSAPDRRICPRQCGVLALHTGGICSWCWWACIQLVDLQHPSIPTQSNFLHINSYNLLEETMPWNLPIQCVLCAGCDKPKSWDFSEVFLCCCISCKGTRVGNHGNQTAPRSCGSCAVGAGMCGGFGSVSGGRIWHTQTALFAGSCERAFPSTPSCTIFLASWISSFCWCIAAAGRRGWRVQSAVGIRHSSSAPDSSVHQYLCS